MKSRGLRAVAFALATAMAHCAAPEGEDVDESAEAEDEVPLDLTIDHVDVDHGALRIRASMADGSPAVGMRLGGDCDGREVGRGFATRVMLVWSLSEEDLGDALRCNLSVQAHTVIAGRRVVEVASLEVALDVTAVASDDDTNAPAFRELAVTPAGLRLAFQSPVRPRALTVGDRRVAPLPHEDDDDPASVFETPYAALARALLEDRPIRLDSTAFALSLAVGGAALERADTGAAIDEEEVPEANP